MLACYQTSVRPTWPRRISVEADLAAADLSGANLAGANLSSGAT